MEDKFHFSSAKTSREQNMHAKVINLVDLTIEIGNMDTNRPTIEHLASQQRW